MTKKIYYIFTLIGSLLLSSCDSYLDIQPVGQVIPNTLAEYRALFTTAYNTALNDRGICEIRTDIATILQSDATSKNSLGDVEKWNDVNPNASTRQFGWAAYYTNIYYANAIIDKKDEISEGSQEDINQLVGEAYLMRAYMHFILVNLYGQPYTATGALETKAVPLKLNTDLEEIPSRNTVKEIYTSILSDIETARKLINKKEWEFFIEDRTIFGKITGTDKKFPILTGKDFTEVVGSFDRNMNPVLVYHANNAYHFYWFDTVTNNYVTEELTSDVTSPRLCLDDKRDEALVYSDVILTYIKDTKLIYRLQRDRFALEYIAGEKGIKGREIIRFGMNKSLRLQWTLDQASKYRK